MQKCETHGFIHAHGCPYCLTGTSPEGVEVRICKACAHRFGGSVCPCCEALTDRREEIDALKNTIDELRRELGII